MRMKLIQDQRPETTYIQQPEIITIGKINFIVSERFSDNGKEIVELIERLAVEKCRKIS